MKLAAIEHYDISLLYVEDERVTREQVSRILQRVVTELHVAENGREGLALYRKKRPDIVLSDIMMPLLNGLDMCREIRQLDHDSQLIMLTAYSDTEYLLECIALGVNQYVRKPVDFAQLTGAIETCSNYILLKRKIQQQEERIYRLSQALEQAPAPVMITSLNGSIEYVNAMFTRLCGYTAEEALGRNPRLLKSDMNPPEMYTELWQTIVAGREWQGELANKHKDGSIFWETVKVCPLRDNNGEVTGFLKVSQDITARKQYEESLHYLGTHDPLTGLYNRAYFDAELQRLDNNRDFPVSIVAADIDGLKAVNDSQGHAAGDQLIKEAAKVLLSAFRAADVVARIGGDEFAVLLPRTEHDAAQAAMQRIRENGAHEREFEATARLLSLGMATAEQAGTLHETMKLADKLMYADKLGRKSRRSSPPEPS
jgi:diguanylate cyclase (GGDEF)-like protein/PAS domain S-box-containing protein